LSENGIGAAGGIFPPPVGVLNPRVLEGHGLSRPAP